MLANAPSTNTDLSRGRKPSVDSGYALPTEGLRPRLRRTGFVGAVRAARRCFVTYPFPDRPPLSRASGFAMLRPAVFLMACLFAAFFGAVSAGVGYYLAAASQRLVVDGVAGVGVVTRLTSHQAGSATSRTTVYRVFLQVNEPGGPLTLSDDLAGDAWRQLAEGDSVGVVYVPGDDRYCQVGDKAAVAATYDRARLVTLLGGAVTAVSLGAAAWVTASRHGRSALAVARAWEQSGCPA